MVWRGGTRHAQGLSFAQRRGEAKVERAMRPAYGQELPEFALKEHAPCSHPVQRHPSENQPWPKAVFVFQKDGQIVPKVQVRFEGA